LGIDDLCHVLPAPKPAATFRRNRLGRPPARRKQASLIEAYRDERIAIFGARSKIVR
jgi:hypothetical protein